MNTMIHRGVLLAAAAALILAAAGPARADDTEIYTGASGNGIQPNVLFIIDTSGSMGTQVYTQQPYDPSTTYTGDYDTSQTYWGYVASSGGGYTRFNIEGSFASSWNRCAASQTALANNGYYTGTLAFWDPNAGHGRHRQGAWQQFPRSYGWGYKSWGGGGASIGNYVECQADNGSNGDSQTSDPTAAPWAANGTAGPWSASQSDSVSWASTGSSETIYTGNYLNYLENAQATFEGTRLSIVQGVTKQLINSVSGINVGLMRFDNGGGSYPDPSPYPGITFNYGSDNGGYVVYPMQDVVAARSSFPTAIDSMSPGGNTPLAETMYEAAQYYRGGPVEYGDHSAPGLSADGSRIKVNGNPSHTYASPIQAECQKNFIVYLTDGLPTTDGGADTAIKDLPGWNEGDCSYSSGSDCLPNLAGYLYKTDQSSAYNGEQNITTYTVGFEGGSGGGSPDPAFLQQTAQNGGGKFYLADDTSSLTQAFHSIITQILKINTTFTAPAVSVNAFNRIQNRNELYFTLFRPTSYVRWPGNVKRFDLGHPTGSSSSGPLEIVDTNGNAAVDQATGFFKDSATSFWTPTSDAPDGGDVTKGGAASLLSVPPNRKVYTYTGSSSDLTTASNLLSTSNSAINDALLSLGTGTTCGTTCQQVVHWAQGKELDANGNVVTDSSGNPVPRQELGDPLHSVPRIVTYGGTQSDPQMVLYVTTNDGYLHAFNVGAIGGTSFDGTSSGQEMFTFIPPDELPRLQTLMDDNAGSHIYGLDGSVTAWVKDVNRNGKIEPSAGDHVYIYFGMRRGGRNYYALDVTNPADPKFLWEIKGGTDSSGNALTPGFANLGQSWSQPTMAKIDLNGTATEVLIFGGGYDTSEDSGPGPDSMGDGVYIVNATTGNLIWRAGPDSGANLQLTGMDYAIPSRVSVVDLNNDGLADRLYVGDMGGNVWRIDLNESNTGAGDLASDGYQLASLGSAASSNASDNRRFYYQPDIAPVYKGPGAPYLAVAIGSGYRAHPLDTTVHDQFFVLKDPNINGNPSATPTPIQESDLYNATSDVIGTGSSSQQQSALATLSSDKGWYINMQEPDSSWIGEKVLAAPLIVNGSVTFTTFTPVASNSTSSCAPSQGRARAYTVNLENATPVFNLDNVGSSTALTQTDRYTELKRGGIPPSPTLIFPSGSEASGSTSSSGSGSFCSGGNQPVLLVGPEKIPTNVCNAPVITYWHDDKY